MFPQITPFFQKGNNWCSHFATAHFLNIYYHELGLRKPVNPFRIAIITFLDKGYKHPIASLSMSLPEIFSILHRKGIILYTDQAPKKIKKFPPRLKQITPKQASNLLNICPIPAVLGTSHSVLITGELDAKHFTILDSQTKNGYKPILKSALKSFFAPSFLET